MTASLPATTNPRTLTSAPSLPAKLNDLVLSGDSPIVGPESAKALAAFAEAPEPPLATQEQVETMIGKLAMATAQAKVSEGEASARVEMFWLALRDLPVDDLRGAFLELLRGSKFMPTPAEVRSAAVRQGAQRRYAKSRAKHLAWKHEQEWKPALEQVAPDELRALLAGVKIGT